MHDIFSGNPDVPSACNLSERSSAAPAAKHAEPPSSIGCPWVEPSPRWTAVTPARSGTERRARTRPSPCWPQRISARPVRSLTASVLGVRRLGVTPRIGVVGHRLSSYQRKRDLWPWSRHVPTKKIRRWVRARGPRPIRRATQVGVANGCESIEERNRHEDPNWKQGPLARSDRGCICSVRCCWARRGNTFSCGGDGDADPLGESEFSSGR